jgi:hypothetical protein
MQSESHDLCARSLNWSEAAAGWVGTWHARGHQKQHSWPIAGVGYDQAFANVAQGAVLLAAGRGDPVQLLAHGRPPFVPRPE